MIYICGDSFCVSDLEYGPCWTDLLAEKFSICNLAQIAATNLLIAQQVDRAIADNAEKKLTRAKAILFIKDKGSNPFLQTSIPGLFSQAFAEKYPAEINELINKSKHFSPQALVQYYEAMIQRPDRTEVLKKFPKPILFIIGEKDNVIPLQSSLQQCYLPAQAHIHILEKSAHMAMLEETEKANEILYHFLKLI